MGEPNVSIYDMLMKHVQQRPKEDCPEKQQQQQQQQQQEVQKQPKGKVPPHNRRADARDSSNKTAKFRVNRARAMADEGPVGGMATNVVTATHLTKKQSPIMLRTGTNKDALNQLVSKMTAFTNKQQARVAAGAAPAAVDAPAPAAAASIVIKKCHKAASKSVPNRSYSRPRQPLSPSNPNRQSANKMAAAAVPAKDINRAKPQFSSELKPQRRAKNPSGVVLHRMPTKLDFKDPSPVNVQRFWL